MIKILNRYFSGQLMILLITENALILLGIWIAVAIRLRTINVPFNEFSNLLAWAFLVTVICQVCFYYADLYDLRTITSRMHILIRLLYAVGAASFLLSAFLYIFPSDKLTAAIIEISLVGVIGLILFWRLLLERLNRAYTAGEKILVVGSGPIAHALANEIRLRHDLPIKMIGSVAETKSESDDSIPGLECLGDIDGIEQIIESAKPNRVVVALKERRRQLPYNSLLKYRLKGIRIEDASTLYEKLTGRIPVESIRPSELIFSDGFSHSLSLRFYERVFGLIGAALGLIVCGPIMLLTAIAIVLESPGPALYRQQRVGKNGELFDILKFRSMRSDAEAKTGPQWAAEGDSRVTRVGRFIRKVRLDELPQFINILKGEMSFVGPRPERPYFVDLLSTRVPFFDLRHSVRPGVTGWAQVSYPYGASVADAKSKLEYDLFYVKNVSVSLDLLILFQTVQTVLFGKGAR